MGFKLANTTFSTKPDETLAAVDAYTQDTAGKTNNATPDINDAINIGGFSGLKGGNLGEGLDIFGKVQSTGFKANPDALLKGIVGANSALSSALGSLSGGLKSDLLKNGGMSNITATLDGIKSSIAGADLTTLKGLGSLIRGVSTSNFPISFFDKGGLTNFATNIIKQAAGVGIPNAFKAFADGLGDDNIMSKVMKNLLPDVVSTSNINLLSNMAGSKYGVDIKKFQPSFISDFSRAFTMPKGSKQRNYGSMFRSVTGSFNAIDSKWDKYTRPSGEVSLDMTAMGKCSRDFDTLLTANANSTRIPLDTANPATLNTSDAINDLVKAKAIKDMYKESLGPGEEIVGTIGSSNIIASSKSINISPDAALSKSFPTVVQPKESLWSDLANMASGRVKGQWW